VPIDVNWYDEWGHELTNDAALMWVVACCYSKRLMSDGKLTLAQLRRIGPAITDDALMVILDELVDRRAFVRASNDAVDAYRIRGWNDWNDSAAAVSLRAKRKHDGAVEANHKRWHEARGVVDFKCILCQTSESDKRSDKRSVGDQYSESTDIETESETESETETINKTTRANATHSAVGGCESDFDECWKAYPRKLARKPALKAYQARRKAGVTKSDLLTATQNYARAAAGKLPEHVMHGGTFYGPNERWRDYVGEQPEAFVVGNTDVASGAPSMFDQWRETHPDGTREQFDLETYGEPIDFGAE
jgi:hypothetical protein